MNNRLIIKIMVILSIFLSAGISSFAQNKEDLSNSPFSKREMRDTRKVYRAVASGSSVQMQVASSIAITNCRHRLAEKVGEVKETTSTQEDGEVITKRTVKGNLENAVVKKKVFTKDKNGVYTCWVLMETPKK